MNYVMSDLHGCYDAFMEMLRKINFSENDHLYILGDLVDRGPHGIRIIQEVMNRGNITALRGNHDQEAMLILSKENTFWKDYPEFREAMKLWLLDGGQTTYDEFHALSEEEQKKVLEYMNSMELMEEITVNGQKYFLAHTVPSKEEMTDYESCLFSDFLSADPDYDKVYFEDTVIITGHTPTDLIDPAYAGKIWKKNHHIAIDCGCCFGEALGCLCMENGQEWYCVQRHVIEKESERCAPV